MHDLIKLGLSDPDTSKLSLYHMGNPYPFWVVESHKIEDSIIYFYAPPSDKASNIKETIFILALDEQDTENRLYPINVPKEVDQDLQPSIGTIVQHLEEQNLYLPDSKGADHWYWAMITSKDEIEVEFSIPEIESLNMKIRVQLWSPSSNPSIHPDHSIRIIINQSTSRDIDWDGKGAYTAEMIASLPGNTSDISIQILTNELGDQIPQKIYLDWIEVEYQQPLNFSDETIHFKIDNDLVIQTEQSDGFLLANSIEKVSQQIYQIPVQLTNIITNNTETHFSWVPQANFKTIDKIQAIQQPQMDFAPVDYLVIAPKALHQSLTPLMEFRIQQGYQTALLSTQQIYDSYASGTPSPFAIQSLLKHITAENAELPKYLLLVGDLSYEILEYETSLQMLPSFFMDTSLAGETISDFPYADLDGDFKPDLVIGRVPTSDPDQLADWVDKLLKYEKQPIKYLRNIIAISDSSSSTFQVSASSFLESLVSFPEKSKIYISGEEDFIENNQQTFGEQNSLISYFGHGSIDRWGQQPILSSQQFLEMKTPFNPAFIFNFSCLNGYFIHPEKLSLTETLLFHPNAGTVAVLASTSLTLHESQIKFSNQIISALQLGGKMNIGDLVTSALREIDSENQLNRDVINTFILFGDPATSFPSIQTPQGN